MIALLLGAVAPARGDVPPPAAPAPFADPATLDAKVPTPESIIGHAVGARAVRYDALVRYLQALAEASPFVVIEPHGQTHEARTLYHLTISSEANLANLGKIKADNAKLHDPRGLSDADGDRIVNGLPGIAWMAYSIHGDELSSTDAAMQLAYQLAAGTDEGTKKLRDELVIHIDPLMNPDGRERYLGQLQHLAGKVPNPDYQAMQHRGLWGAGRGNHYLFDMNRDWMMMIHPETRGRAAAILAWHPHLLVDSHEMGAMETYLMDPPREPINPVLFDKNRTWRAVFSKDQSAAFDRRGWSYYTQEWYEEWYPGYTNAWINLMGGVGLLYEQGETNSHIVKQHAGNIVSYRDGVHHQLVSSLANLETLRVNRKGMMRDWLADRRWAVSEKGAINEVFLVAPGPDAARMTRFTDLLTRHGIEFAFASAGFHADGVADVWGERVDTKDLPAGTLIIRSNQPQRRLLHAILGFDPRMSDAFLLEERKDVENHRGSRIYDVTGWSLPMAYGLEAYWADRVATVATTDKNPVQAPPPGDIRAAAFGYLIDGATSEIFKGIVTLLEAGRTVRVATKPFKIGGKAYLPGTVLLRVNENAADLPAALKGLASALGLDVRPTDTALAEEGPDLGGVRFALLQLPRVAVASQWPVDVTSFGATWHLLDDRVGLRCSPINIQSLGNIDLRKYNVIILPSAGGAMKSALEGALKPLKAWVESGGTLIAYGGSAAALATEAMQLSAVRERRDVLEDLPAYEEALEREDSARNPTVNSAEVWGDTPPPAPPESPPTPAATPPTDKKPDDKKPADKKPDDKKPGDDKTKDDKTADNGDKDNKDEETPDEAARKRLDEWQRLFAPEGTIVAAQLDPEHWLCFGLGERLPVLLSGSTALMAKEFGSAPVRLMGEDDLRLSGLLWPEARARWARTAYATVEQVGNGQVVLFLTEPCFRGYYEGSSRLLLNAILLGPGLGATPPVPW